MAERLMPVADACGAFGTRAGADGVSGAGAGTDAEEDGVLCGVTPPGEESPGQACTGRSRYAGLLASTSKALV